MQISIKDFIKFRDYVYKRSGIFFETKKIYFVRKRLAARLDACGMDSVEEYLDFLRHQDAKGHEFQELINSLTTNETYFFREFDQLAAFGEHCLVETEDRKIRECVRRIRVWSAGCSTGEEPYTLAIILLEILDSPETWDIRIFGTDIDTSVLARAEEGLYSKRSVKDVPEEYLARYFSCENNMFRIKPAVKRLVRFKQINLMDSRETSSMRRMDFIFCRNVLIYFDDTSRKKVVGHFYDSLMPGGYIFLGHSESMSRISTAFTVRKMGGMIVYQKPGIGSGV